MNRLFTFSTSLLLAANAVAASCPREDFRAMWNLLGADRAFVDLNPEVYEPLVLEWAKDMADLGVVHIDPVGGYEILIAEPLREVAPYALTTYIDLSCTAFIDQPVPEFVQFLQTPKGQRLVQAVGQGRDAAVLVDEITAEPAPNGSSWDDIISVLDFVADLEADIEEKFRAEIEPVIDQKVTEDRIADMFTRPDIVTFKSDKHRELAIKLYRITAEVERFNQTGE